MEEKTRKELWEILSEIFEQREFDPCWLGFVGEDEDEGDCANWDTCFEECPLVRLRNIIGYPSKESGNTSEYAAREGMQIYSAQQLKAEIAAIADEIEQDDNLYKATVYIERLRQLSAV